VFVPAYGNGSIFSVKMTIEELFEVLYRMKYARCSFEAHTSAEVWVGPEVDDYGVRYVDANFVATVGGYASYFCYQEPAPDPENPPEGITEIDTSGRTQEAEGAVAAHPFFSGGTACGSFHWDYDNGVGQARAPSNHTFSMPESGMEASYSLTTKADEDGTVDRGQVELRACIGGFALTGWDHLGAALAADQEDKPFLKREVYMAFQISLAFHDDGNWLWPRGSVSNIKQAEQPDGYVQGQQAGELVVTLPNGGTVTQPLYYYGEGNNGENSLENYTAAATLDLSGTKFWPYKNSEGSPVWDASSGAQLANVS
jgi:hypothetical protein